MKRVILAAVFIVALSGFAAAQSTSATQATKPKKAIVNKSVSTKNNTAHTVLRQEASSNAKADSTMRLLLPLPKISDTSALPAVKKDEEL